MLKLRQDIAGSFLVAAMTAAQAAGISSAWAQSLPEIRVDQEHLQMQAAGSKQTIY